MSWMVQVVNKLADWLPGGSPDLSIKSKSGGKHISVDDMKPFAYSGQQFNTALEHTIYDGEKFPGGFGPTLIEQVDYWTLRIRSSELFNNNLYARGLIRRLITNEIHTGLTPQVIPEASILGMDPDVLAGWADNVEIRFKLWAKNPQLCDHDRQRTFASLQTFARREALVDGDVLVVMRQSPRTKMPAVQLIRGNRVRDPILGRNNVAKGHIVKHGVEFDNMNRIVAYWVLQQDNKSERLPAFSTKSGRKLAWLVFGTDRRLDDVRGQPLLAIVLQSLKEMDRYRDAAQRKAVVNSFLAMFIQKDEDRTGTLPISGGGVRSDTVSGTGPNGEPTKRTISDHMPGMVIEELAHGEKPVGFNSQGTDLNFPEFEKAITAAIGWAHEVPPEILWLSFTNNYSASQAALNEYKIYLTKFWAEFGDDLCTPVYNAWLIDQALTDKIAAPSLLRAWRDPLQQELFSAWVAVEWYGSVKISTDIVKQAKGSEKLLELGLTTYAREARGTNGSKFDRNVAQLKRERIKLAEAIRPILELKAEFGDQATDEAIAALDDATFTLRDVSEGMTSG